MIEINNVYYTIKNKGQKIEILQDISYMMQRGKVYAILGEQAKDKSAFISLLGGFDLPTEGKITIDRVDISISTVASNSRQYTAKGMGD